MESTMAQTIDVLRTPPVAIGAESSGQDIKHTPHIPGGEEDDSVTTSTISEIFDREPRRADSEGSHKIAGKDAPWPRYGSSDSATSTAISSLCSSVTADDHNEKSGQLDQKGSPSKKRMSDGSFKPTPLRSSNTTSTVKLEGIQSTEKPATEQLKPSLTAPKRRGRPPKDPNAEPRKSAEAAPKVQRATQISHMQGTVRPRSSIPSRLTVGVFASQCIEAAQASRLNPYALHPGEHELMANLLMWKEVTVYLNIRNAILRLWHQNPLCSITPQEAAGCAKEGRFFGLAEVAYKWLVRNGYINFGCVEVPHDPIAFRPSRKTANQKTVVVVGGGVSGLVTARQLEGLFAQGSEQWTSKGERPPRVIVLEGRKRVGGRVYSKALRTQVPGSLPGDLRNTAEMGAMIITGFEHGNPLDTIIRGQLGLRYHLMKDELTIYDCDGKPVNEQRDMLNTELYADISDRAGEFRAVAEKPYTLNGEEDLINRCRDPVADGLEMFQLEPMDDPIESLRKHKPASRRGRRRNAPPGTEKLTGRTRVLEDSNATQSAARAAKSMGWQLREGVGKNQSVNLYEVASASPYPTLGTIMDEAIEQYQDIVELTPQDMRLLNWHHANLEYANAAPVSSLSLSGHDQDTGNEFEGAHSEIIGGYTQLPRGLMHLPTPLDVRFERVVESIHYKEMANADNECKTKVVCSDGEVIEADQVVVTAPLGVLKSDMIDFDPPLPNWKQGAIDRMGFGLLNKVILLYDRPFWDDSRDMLGLLNEADYDGSLDPLHYEKKRGRFFLIWNASRISGRPMLIALMAGHAAYDAETTDCDTLLAEINDRLRGVFSAEIVPSPLEVIVTRWKRDPFTRGTYSYVGPRTQPGDYDLMAKSVGNLHFAGEATCGTHPATVHGAFLSGLRVAADVMHAMVGPISLPNPIVAPLPMKQDAALGSSQVASPAKQASAGASWGTMNLSGPSAPTPFTNVSSTSTNHQHPSLSSTQPSASAGAPQQPSQPYTVAKGYAPLSQKVSGPPRQSVCASDSSFWVSATASQESAGLNYEAAIMANVLSQLGERPQKPGRAGVNPFLLYTKEKWEECKAQCHRDAVAAAAVARENRRGGGGAAVAAGPGAVSSGADAVAADTTGETSAGADTANQDIKTKSTVNDSKATAAVGGRDVIRTTLGKWWRALPDAEKLPYLQSSQLAQDRADALRRDWEAQVAVWDREAARIRKEYKAEHPPPTRIGGGDGAFEVGDGKTGTSGGAAGAGAAPTETVGVSRRKTNTSNCVVLDGV